MPSLAESRQQVNETLQAEVDHSAILAGLQEEIDRHNAIKDDLRDDIRRSKRSRHDSEPARERPTKFRFKAGTKDPRDERRQHRSSRHDHDRERKHHRHSKSHKYNYPTPSDEDQEAEASHPFPREPASPPATTDQDAFRASLFDALADDEGAAAYWESVYSQPIHIYPRPSVQDARTGKLEQMSDEEYVAYVKEKMWEKKNPEVVRERARKEKERREEEEERTRRREEFVRKKERAAWERAQRWRGGESNGEDGEGWERYEYAFAGDVERDVEDRKGGDAAEAEYRVAWTRYLEAWQSLRSQQPADTGESVSSQIPWPVLPGKTVVKTNIEAFLNHIPATSAAERLKIFKAERVRWHPDKIQQRFGGTVDDGTMKLVTGVFQVIDATLEVERKRGGG